VGEHQEQPVQVRLRPGEGERQACQARQVQGDVVVIPGRLPEGLVEAFEAPGQQRPKEPELAAEMMIQRGRAADRRSRGR
jgi:hypothetical protein